MKESGRNTNHLSFTLNLSPQIQFYKTIGPFNKINLKGVFLFCRDKTINVIQYNY